MKATFDSVISNYQLYIHPHFPSKRVSFSDYEKELKRLESFSFLKLNEEGRSIEKRPITSIKFGSGKRKVLIWTQMHGNEASATRALFDLFNALKDDQNEELKNLLSAELQILFLPMLNPDGAERYQRRNALDVDPNRDAAKRETPEIQTLFRIIDEFQPDWCFNMHDQRNLFNVAGTNKPATISFLSPSTTAGDILTQEQKEVMQLIDCISAELSLNKEVGIARFSHEYYPTATGDNIQAMGCKTMLIESGGFRNDPDRFMARKLVYEALLKSFELIANGEWDKGSVESYLQIPMNDTKLFDVLIRNVQLSPSSAIRADVGIEISESFDSSLNRVIYKSIIKDLGDLSHYSGYEEIDASNGCISRSVVLNQKADFDIVFENSSMEKSTIFIRNGYVQ